MSVKELLDIYHKNNFGEKMKLFQYIRCLVKKHKDYSFIVTNDDIPFFTITEVSVCILCSRATYKKVSNGESEKQIYKNWEKLTFGKINDDGEVMIEEQK